MRFNSFVRQFAAAILLIASSSTVHASIVFPADAQASLDLGTTMAQADKVRQLQFDITGGSIARVDGTATPLGPWYSGISKHYFDYVTTTSGSSTFDISIATGTSRSNRNQLIHVSHYLIHPTLDFVLLEHDLPVTGASLPVFGTIAKNEIITFSGMGLKYHFGDTSFFDDGNPSAWRMRTNNISNPTDFILSSQSNFTSGPFDLPGGGTQFDSSSPSYNSAGELIIFLEKGIPGDQAATTSFTTGSGIPFVASGLGDWITTNTPLNVPEPTTLSVLGLGTLLMTRRRGRLM